MEVEYVVIVHTQFRLTKGSDVTGTIRMKNKLARQTRTN